MRFSFTIHFLHGGVVGLSRAVKILVLSRELERVAAQRIYQPEASFIRSLGFIEPSAARRISFEDAIRFERVHEQVYRDFGFQLVFVEPGAPSDRANQINAFLRDKVDLPTRGCD